MSLVVVLQIVTKEDAESLQNLIACDKKLTLSLNVRGCQTSSFQSFLVFGNNDYLAYFADDV